MHYQKIKFKQLCSYALGSSNHRLMIHEANGDMHAAIMQFSHKKCKWQIILMQASSFRKEVNIEQQTCCKKLEGNLQHSS